MTIFGIDVSYYQGSIDWARVASSNAFATIKASSGTWAQTTDSGPYFRAQFPRAKASGMLVGGYHWLRTTDVALQVENFLMQWQAVGGYRGHIVQLDWESLPVSGGTERPSWSIAKAWLAEWRRRTNNYPVVIYVPDWFYPQIPGRPSSENLSTLRAPIWASEYSSGGYPGDSSTNWHSYGGVAPSILQYTSSASVPGVSGGCDRNAYRGTLAQLRAMLTGASQTSGYMFTDLAIR